VPALAVPAGHHHGAVEETPEIGRFHDLAGNVFGLFQTFNT